MHPVLFQLGSFTLRTYTLTSFVAMLMAMLPVLSEAKRLRWRLGEPTWWYVVKCTIVGWIGAHVMYAFTRFDLPWDEWFRLLFVGWGMGNVWFGGLLLVWLYVSLTARRCRIPIFQMTDTAVFAAMQALGWGRWGCFFGGCCYGSPTTLPWGYSVPNREGYTGLLHPTPVYEFVFSMAVFAWLWSRRKRNTYNGQTTVLYVYASSIGRFAFEFLRGDTIRGFVLGWLTTSQFIALGMIVFAVIAQAKLSKRADLVKASAG